MTSAETPNQIDLEPPEPFENELCISCLRPNAPLVKFCRHCRAPLHPLAAWLPFDKIFATGFVWRSAVLTPRRWIVIIGIYLYFLPALLSSALMLKLQYSSASTGQLTGLVMIQISLSLVALAISSAISLLILILTTVNFAKYKRNR